MSTARKRPPDRSDDEARDQEVVRATRELTAYFRGARTEREARAALKIIKAFVRDRERIAPAERRPLPGQAVARAPRAEQPHGARAASKTKRKSRPPRPHVRELAATLPDHPVEPPPPDEPVD